MHFLHTLELPALRDAEGGGLGGGGNDNNGASSDGAAGGFADAGAASASFDGSVSAVDGSGNASNSVGTDYGAAGGGIDYGSGYGVTGADVGQAAAVGVGVGLGPIGAAVGIVASSGITQATGATPFSSAVNFVHDMSLSLGVNLAANPSQLAGLFATTAEAIALDQQGAAAGMSGPFGFLYDPQTYAVSSGGSEGGGVG